MKIRNISCTQFAGIRDRSISFSDGLNVIFGKNESGKSTVVNLLARTLFQRARLDRRSDKEFFELYFPGAKRSGKAGDFADGRVVFETEDGSYTLSKEWGKDARCTLSTPDGVLREQGSIDEILREALTYGEGLYCDLLLSSQRNTDAALQTILDAAKKTEAKQEIVNAVSQAFAETGGVGADAIEGAIMGKIAELAGSHWNIDTGAPKAKAGRWSKDLGEVLKAYYALEDARNVLADCEAAEQAESRYLSEEIKMRQAEKAYFEFNTFAGRIAAMSARKNALKNRREEEEKLAKILRQWPSLLEILEKAETLQKEKTDREMLDRYAAAKQLVQELDSIAEAGPCPTAVEIRQAKTAQTDLARWENQLRGMNLNASVRMFADHELHVTSLRTGQEVELSNITEAVKITVDGVMELQLSPANVDVDAVNAEIKKCKKITTDILEKYGVKTVEELESLALTISEAMRKHEEATGALKLLLGSTSFDELQSAVSGITAREKGEIDREILYLCRGTEITRFIIQNQTVVDGYEKEYGSVKELKVKMFDLREELEKLQERTCEEIPAEFADIDDPEAHLKTLKDEWDEKKERCEKSREAKVNAEKKLAAYGEIEDPKASFEKAERLFCEQKSLLEHWLHIAAVFRAEKEAVHDNPLQDIADRFSYNLSVISGGGIASEFPEADRLNMNIYSGNSLLDYGKLSEGTKETVSLAFRLAVLDHLFPDGGGMIVFDDPLTDMDAQRAAQACELLKRCAEQHQVIFLTCREEYCALLGVQPIRF